MEIIEKAGINVEYLYPSLEGSEKNPEAGVAERTIVIFKLKDHDAGIARAKAAGLDLVDTF
jgi:hypothetical protein